MTAVYLEDWFDEQNPADDLDGWAKWLFANAPEDGPGRAIQDGETFKVYIMDVHDYTATRHDEKVFVFDPQLEDPIEVAVRMGEDLGWTEDDFFYSLDSLTTALIETYEVAIGEQAFLAQIIGRPGEFTVTYTFIDGEPVLQPDGWVL